MDHEAYRVFIPEMRIESASFAPKDPDPTDQTPAGNRKFSVEYSQNTDIPGYFPDFPVIISGKTLQPWTLSNLYLLRKLAFDTAPYESKTYNSISQSLLDYLRFLERHDIDPLEFHPRFKTNRPTYRYRADLIERAKAESIALSTAKKHIGQVIRFYRGLVAYGILESTILNKVHVARKVLIPIITQWGFTKDLVVESSDLSIRKASSNTDPDIIQDGGKLKPLTKDEQDALFEALQDSEYCIFLFFLFALMTGARLQTVGTLRIESLRKAPKDTSGFYRVKVGGGTKVDTKQDKPQTLKIPESLYRSLMIYIQSPIAVRRRKSSFYGDSDNNYVFLNRNGEPYYTSKVEESDRRNPDHHKKVGIHTAASHIKPKEGDAIRTYIRDTLIPRIQKSQPDFSRFRFHDLRATFGMNAMETYLKQVDMHNAQVDASGGSNSDKIGSQWALEQVQERLGHASIKTTMQYLDYKRNKEWRAKLIDDVENQLMQYVPAAAEEALESK